MPPPVEVSAPMPPPIDVSMPVPPPATPPAASPPAAPPPPAAPKPPAVPLGEPIQSLAAEMPSIQEIAEETEATLVNEIMAEARLETDPEQRALLAAGVRGLVAFLVRSDSTLVDIPVCDLLISELTHKMSLQIDEIMHHDRFQELESAWRGLRFVVQRVQFRENIRVELLNVSKRDLLEDFQDAPEIPKSGLFRIVYSAEFGQFGGRPYGFIVGNYTFAPTPQDIALLGDCGAVATMAHAPFVAAAAPQFFGMDNFLRLPHLNELHALFEGPQYTKWQAFRESEDGRFVALCLPRFLLRLPYGATTNRVKAFEYEEDVVANHERYLWGNAAFALATRVAESFAKYRWCPHIIGPSSGGTVTDLPLHEYEAMGHIQTKIPTEIMISERREYAIAQEGFIPFTYRPDTANACFFSANSVQKAKTFGISKEGRQAELNHRLGTQLPYLFVIARLAHYIKVIQRENIGSWKERNDLEHELQKWIRQYVADQDVVSASVRARRPLRRAKITISDVPGNAGWYKIDLQVQPHFRYMGAVFHLGLVGRMDQE
jgi:type VI secretion system protein ImpC